MQFWDWNLWETLEPNFCECFDWRLWKDLTQQSHQRAPSSFTAVLRLPLSISRSWAVTPPPEVAPHLRQLCSQWCFLPATGSLDTWLPAQGVSCSFLIDFFFFYRYMPRPIGNLKQFHKHRMIFTKEYKF